MAAGDTLIMSNTSDTSTTFPNGGTEVTLTYNNTVSNRGSSISYSSGLFTVGETGKYLLSYSEAWGNASWSNVLMVEIEVHINGSDSGYGTSYGYMSGTGGSQSYINFASVILDLTSGDEVELVAKRRDSQVSGSAPPNRLTDRSGVQILKLDDTWEYAMYERTTNQSLGTGTNTLTEVVWSTVQEDSSFTKTGNRVYFDNSYYYFIIMNLPVSNVSTASEFQSDLNTGPAHPEQNGFLDSAFLDNTSNCDAGNLATANLFDPDSGFGYRVRMISRSSAGSPVLEAGATFQIIRMPLTAGLVRWQTDTGTSLNINASGQQQTLETQNFSSGSSFTVSLPDNEFDVNNAGDYIVCSNVFQGGGYGTGNHAVSAHGVSVNGTEQEHIGNSAYHSTLSNRDQGSLGFLALLPELEVSDTLAILKNRIGTVTTTLAAQRGIFSAIDLSTLFSYSTPSSNIKYRNSTLWGNVKKINGILVSNIKSVNNITV